MTRATRLLPALACAFVLGCGHEASAPSTLRDAPIVARAPEAPAAPEAPRTPDASCIDVEDDDGAAHLKHITLEGHVFVDDVYEHPARGKTHPYILRLDEPRCALGIDTPRITELHLASIDGVSLKGLAGQHVRVSGDPFSAHTAWHARPIVLMTTKATALR
jgi:hypothetical protein